MLHNLCFYIFYSNCIIIIIIIIILSLILFLDLSNAHIDVLYTLPLNK